jgi:hypothetical protein
MASSVEEERTVPEREGGGVHGADSGLRARAKGRNRLKQLRIFRA